MKSTSLELNREEKWSSRRSENDSFSFFSSRERLQREVVARESAERKTRDYEDKIRAMQDQMNLNQRCKSYLA